MEERLYIDSNILIYHLVDDRRYGPKCRTILEKISTQHIHGYSSVYIIAEVYATLRAFGFQMNKIIEALDNIGKLGISLLPLSAEIMMKVPDLMKKEKAGFGDAIHMLTMRANNISGIITEDEHFDRLQGIRRISIDSLAGTEEK